MSEAEWFRATADAFEWIGGGLLLVGFGITFGLVAIARAIREVGK